MREEDLRALVRDAVSRHLGRRDEPGREVVHRPAALPSHDHVSHAVYINLVNADDSCVIEPAVACTHCNYCRSHGH
ncbi:MAG TPA: hypothetical protein VH679_09700 [Vicinamibacterales bacterium]|jgi:threonine dehydrogenase-like Zn-dependent dehydrogenase